MGISAIRCAMSCAGKRIVRSVTWAYRHLWGGSACNRAANSEYQTRLLLNDYILQLIAQGGHLAENCIRTWFLYRM